MRRAHAEVNAAGRIILSTSIIRYWVLKRDKGFWDDIEFQMICHNKVNNSKLDSKKKMILTYAQY